MLQTATTAAEEELRVLRLREAIDQRLSALLPGGEAGAGRLGDAMRHALLSPGKRLRPLLTLLTAWRLGAEEDAALDLACAVELVHAASLVLDDAPCMDNAKTRRGRPATHVVYGEEVAVLAAVGLLNQAYALLAAAPGLAAETRLEMVAVLARAVGADGLVGGQERDLRRDAQLSRQEINEINAAKTSVLFEACVRLGALAADAPAGVTQALVRFARELGLAFQAADDIADGAGADGAASDNGGVDGGDKRPTTLSVLGPEGAKREAARRMRAAVAALDSAGGALSGLGVYVDLVMHAR